MVIPILRMQTIRDAVVERLTESPVRWRQLGSLFVIGGALALLSLLVPGVREASSVGVAACGAAAVVGGALVTFFAERLPGGDGALSVKLVSANLLITVVIIAHGSPGSAFALFYVWVGFEAFCLFRGGLAAAHLIMMSLCYAVALAATADDAPTAISRWVIASGIVAVVTVLADVLRSRRDRLIEQLADAARTDVLTGLLNRRGFEERIAHELERASRQATDVSIVMGDIDHFKAVNDRHGHERGDEALKAFGRLAVSTVGIADCVARLGGEEFAIVLPGVGPQGALETAERLRLRTRQTLTSFGAGGLSVSFGVASWPEHGHSAEELVLAADQALYCAKRTGRGRTVVSGPDCDCDGGFETRAEQLPAVLMLAEALDLRSTGTAQHSRTVGRYAEATARALGLDPERTERIRLAGLLHDIGKIGVPDPILHKPGPLDEEEWAAMRGHPELGAHILRSANLDDVAEWVMAHHERIDGLGYPAGLASEDIPLEARILSVADAFEAMIADRAYRPGLPICDAIAELRRHAGTQFDREVVDAFVGTLGHPRRAEPGTVTG